VFLRRSAFEIVGILAGLILAAAGSASSQGLGPSAADLKGILNADEAAIIFTTDGRRLTGSVEGVSDTTLTLRTRTHTEILLLERLREVRVRRRDPLWNGVLVGTGTGALAGLIPDHYYDCAECHDALYGSMALGAGIGLLVDIFRRGTRVVYRAPVREQAISLGCHVSGGRSGVALRWSF
jgi:hypothetical protein